MNKVTVLGVVLTPKDSCSIPKDSIYQARIAKPDTVIHSLHKQFILKADIANKNESKSDFSNITIMKNDVYREKFRNLQLINIIDGHLSR